MTSEAPSPRYLIHLGYPKAGSTFLQSAVFSGQHPSFHPLGRQPGEARLIPKPGKDLFFNRVEGQRSFVPFDFDAEQARRIARDGALAQPGQTVAISSEELVGHPYSGGIWAEGIAQRIHTILPEARILIMVREQRTMVLSAYSDYLERMAGRASLEHFLRPRGIDQTPAHRPEYYKFSALISHYMSLFGRERVLVLTLEALARDEAGTVDRICDFCEVPRSKDWQKAQATRNTRDYKAYAALRRHPGANVWVRPTAVNGHTGKNIPGLRDALKTLGRIVTTDAAADRIRARDLAQIEAALRPHIPNDNARLQAYVDEDLRGLGYLMPDAPPA